MSTRRSFLSIAKDIALTKVDMWLSEEEIDEQLTELYSELQEKENGVSWFYGTLEEKLSAAKKMREKMTNAIKSLEYSQKRLKQLVVDSYSVTEQLPAHDEFNPIKIMKSSSVEVIDEDKIPETYWKEVTVKKLDKKLLLHDLRDGISIPGVNLKYKEYPKGLK